MSCIVAEVLLLLNQVGSLLGYRGWTTLTVTYEPRQYTVQLVFWLIIDVKVEVQVVAFCLLVTAQVVNRDNSRAESACIKQ